MLCGSCLIKKDVSEFSVNKSKRLGYNSSCKACKRTYNKDHYVKNKDRYFIKNKRNKRIAMIHHINYMKGKCCSECGYNDISGLQFHHQQNKKKNVSSMIGEGYGRKSVLNEIKKCIILCANCHARITAKQQGWYAGVD